MENWQMCQAKALKIKQNLTIQKELLKESRERSERD